MATLLLISVECYVIPWGCKETKIHREMLASWRILLSPYNLAYNYAKCVNEMHKLTFMYGSRIRQAKYTIRKFHQAAECEFHSPGHPSGQCTHVGGTWVARGTFVGQQTKLI